MKRILVGIKRVVDYNVRIRVKPDGSGVITDGVKMSINPFDEIALEEALRIKERGGAEEVVVATVGPADCQQQLRTALAMGADRALHVQADGVVEPLIAARALLKLVEKEQPMLVILGKQAIDDDNSQTGQMLAALWNRPQATFASKVELSDGKARVTREVDAGLETLEVDLPAVITTDLRLNEPRYVKLPDIMKAKKKPLETLTLSALGVEQKQRLKLVKFEPPPQRQKGIRVKDAAELVEALRKKGLGLMTSKVLIVAEHDGAKLNPSTAKCVTCARGISGAEITVVVCAADAAAVAAQAAQLTGVTRVLTVENPANAHLLSATVAPQIVALAGPYTHVFCASTTFGKDLMPRVAALLDTAQVSDIMAVESPTRFRRPIYAGNAILTVEFEGGAKVVGTVRCSVFRGNPGWRLGAHRESLGECRAAHLYPFRIGVGRQERSPRPADRLARRLGRPGAGQRGCLQDPLQPRRQAGRRRGGLTCRCRRRLRAQRAAGGTDGQDHRARAVHGDRHLRRHPTSDRHQGRQAPSSRSTRTAKRRSSR